MQTIYLSNEDTVDIIAGKIKNSGEKEINLVVLSRDIPVLSVVNLKMFKKIAENLNKIISVSTTDMAVRILVENSGMSLKAIEKKDNIIENKIKYAANVNNFSRKQRPVDSVVKNKNFVNLSSGYHHLNKQEPIVFYDFLPVKSENFFEEVKEGVTKFQVPRTSRNIFMGFIAMVIAVIGIAGYVLLPTANIVIAPKANPINATFDFIIEKNIKELNVEEKKIPATVIIANIEKEEQFTATGQKQLTSNATGVVTIFNEWSSFSQNLVINTRLSTADGKVYKITKNIIIPGFVRDEDGNDIPGKIDVPIIASEFGPEYNIDPVDFTILGFKGTAKYAKIYAKSYAAISGGASGFTTVVSADDFKKAKEYLEDEAKKDIISQLDDKKPSDLIMIEQAISVKSGELISSVSLNQPTSKFKASLSISAIAFLFNEKDVKAIAKSEIEKEIAKSELENKNGKNKNYAVVDTVDKGEDKYGDAHIIGLDSIQLSVQWQANKFNLIDENDMRAKIIGKSKEEMEEYVKNNYPDINKINVTLRPFWVTKIPSIEKNVTISLDIPHGE